MFPQFVATLARLIALQHSCRVYSLDGKPICAKGTAPHAKRPFIRGRARHSLHRHSTIMGLFKADFYRFFALGFAGGALLVFGVMAGEHAKPMADNLIPPAQAATTR
ncbi:hypothetical protein ACFSTD_21350 [Novosphingobium colocasiae]